MDLSTYEKQFEDILSGVNTSNPYNSADYINYVKMNLARIKRWNKTGKIADKIITALSQITDKQEWILISEPWCGDAAHTQPFIAKIAEINPMINLKIQNRDAEGSEIDQYLTNGSKSIPILIARDERGEDLFVWGPRPKGAQEMVMESKKNPSDDPEKDKRALQKWYNKDKGSSLQEELYDLMK